MTIKEKQKLMGQVVTISAKYEACHPKHLSRRIHIVKLSNPKTGWVVGFSRCLEGETVYEGYEEGSHFEQTKVIPCVLVRTWPTTKEIKVPFDAISPGRLKDIQSPYLWPAGKNTERAKAEVKNSRCPLCGLFREMDMSTTSEIAYLPCKCQHQNKED